ncbi:MAG: DUF177 domain-containing protein [Acidobacteriota bacterium]
MTNEASLSLETIADEPLRFEFEIPFTLKALDRELLVSIAPARIEGEVSRAEGGYSLSARAAWAGEFECSRCLALYPFAEDDEFLLLLRRRAPTPAEEVSLDREDLDTYFYDDPVVPVAPIIEERIQMAIPMKPLCNEDCLGLCPQCGTDRNLSACTCVTEFADPRWNALKLLKEGEG